MGVDTLVMSRTTMSVEPRTVTSSKRAPAVIGDEHVKARGFGVVAPDATGFGATNGLAEATGLAAGDGLDRAIGVESGVTREVGVAPPQAAKTTSAATSPTFLMLAITLRAIGRYEPDILTSWHKH